MIREVKNESYVATVTLSPNGISEFIQKIRSPLVNSGDQYYIPHNAVDLSSVVCAYLFGWAYIWFTMIPIGMIYLLIRLIQKLWLKRRQR